MVSLTRNFRKGGSTELKQTPRKRTTVYKVTGVIEGIGCVEKFTSAYSKPQAQLQVTEYFKKEYGLTKLFWSTIDIKEMRPT